MATTTSPHSASGRPVTECLGDGRMIGQDRLDLGGATFSPPLTIVSAARPVTVRTPIGAQGSEVSGAQPAVGRRGPGRDRRGADLDLAAGGDPDPCAEQGHAEGRHLRAGLGEPVSWRDRHPGARAPARSGPARSARRPGAPSAAAAAVQSPRRAAGRASWAPARRGSAPRRTSARQCVVGVEALVEDRRRRPRWRCASGRTGRRRARRQGAQPALSRVGAQRHGRAERAPQPVAVGELDRPGLGDVLPRCARRSRRRRGRVWRRGPRARRRGARRHRGSHAARGLPLALGAVSRTSSGTATAPSSRHACSAIGEVLARRQGDRRRGPRPGAAGSQPAAVARGRMQSCA